MAWPVPSQHKVTTPYGKRGSYWSCNEDSSGNGVHTGVDLGCPSNTPMYAAIAGTIRHRNYGGAFGDRQFAISPSEGQPFAKGEVFYAHGNERLADGTEVQVGDYVGKSGARGNVSGPHLHFEYHADTKGAWNCSVHDNPQPVLDHGGSSGGSSGGPYVVENVYRSKCGYGEPSNGDSFSDTIKELQSRLNNVTLSGGQTLTVNGKYDADTDEEVRLWQKQVCGDTPDPVNKSYLGPNQFKVMFPDAVYTLHDDGDPAVASGGGSTPPPTSSGTTLGGWLKAQGFTVEDSNVPLGRESTWRKVEFLMVHHTGGKGDCTKSESDLAHYCKTGTEYPPICHILLSKTAKAWLTCQELAGQPDPGRSSHAGEGDGYGIPDDTMNERCLGIEVQCDGTHPLSTHATQYVELIELLAALTKKYNVPVSKIIGHKEWSSTGKTDPRDDMNKIRADVQAALSDTPPPEPEVPPVTETPDPPESITFPLGIQYHYSGKPAGSLVFSGSYKKLDVASFKPKKDGLTFGMLYANVDGEGEFRTKLVRENPNDDTSFQTHYGKAGDNYLLTHVWFESGEGGRGLHYEFCSMDGTTHTVTTRYAKFVTIPWDVTVVLEGAVKVYEAARSTAGGIKGLLKGVLP